MDPKQLKKLAAACRAAGITHYKDASGVEFTLSDHLPTKSKRKEQAPLYSQGDVESDTLSHDDLLLWSAGDIPNPGVSQ